VVLCVLVYTVRLRTTHASPIKHSGHAYGANLYDDIIQKPQPYVRKKWPQLGGH